MSAPTTNRPLTGVRVLDLSRILAGPYAAQMLGDLGADVVKVEHPERGDDTRRWGPPFVNNAQGERGNSAYFYCANRNKQFIGIDFKTPTGQQQIRDLVADVDVLIENYKVGSLSPCGLDYESLKSVNPRLIYCSISGFGQTGPYRDRPGYDFVIQGMSGLMSITGKPDHEPGGGPVRVGVAVADLSAGLHAVTGILAALHARNTTNRGCHIDISLLDVQISMLANQASNYLNGGVVPSRIGNTHPNIVPYQVFETADKPMIVAVGNDTQFKRFCIAIDSPALATDKRFVHNEDRVENRALLEPLIADVLKTGSAGYWLEKLLDADIPAGPVNDLEQVFEDPQVVARQLRFEFDTEDTNGVKAVANPIVFSV